MRKVILLGVFTAAAFVASPQQAQASQACFTDLADCYQRAANIDSFWYRWAAGLDCELDLVECVRIKLIGS